MAYPLHVRGGRREAHEVTVTGVLVEAAKPGPHPSAGASVRTQVGAVCDGDSRAERGKVLLNVAERWRRVNARNLDDLPGEAARQAPRRHGPPRRGHGLCALHATRIRAEPARPP